ncbi:hypothetical protein FUAX_04480 [Fulvitalea axinellae]|uniref:Uncharacterized protein n=2 Tax=Fulvitalea axinellae TaxID=1182444 RepID=A0AAU9C7F8_9BACT|nr:hypothetical protein FUAX_04480 [Fulvitalea axinellae]
MPYTIDPDKILAPEHYTLVAKNLSECQEVLSQVELIIEEKNITLMALLHRPDRYSEQLRRQDELVNTLQNRVKLLESQVKRISQPIVKMELEAEALKLKAKLASVKSYYTDAGLSPTVRDVLKNIRIAECKATIHCYTEAMEKYLNTYMMTGKLGSGSVMFLGKKYVAKTATVHSG